MTMPMMVMFRVLTVTVVAQTNHDAVDGNDDGVDTDNNAVYEDGSSHFPQCCRAIQTEHGASTLNSGTPSFENSQTQTDVQ